jgi:hypothetical protein
MGGKLSSDDRERIKRFAKTPRYKRTPDQLCPSEDEESD